MLDEPTSLPPENNQIDLEELWVNQIDEKSKSPNEALKNIKEGIERSKESSRPIEYQDTTQILEKTTNLSKRAEDVGFWRNDLHAISERNITYGKYLSDYCFNFNKKAKSQRRLRRCFFLDNNEFIDSNSYRGNNWYRCYIRKRKYRSRGSCFRN